MECSIKGCDKPHNSNGLCKAHGLRLYKTGCLLKKPKIFDPWFDSKGKYLRHGREAVHRLVYKQSYPKSLPNCWSCDMPLSWDMGWDMHIDHIDQNPLNNHISNLQASCNGCNMSKMWRSKLA